MRILLISDIHANIVALEKVLTEAPAYDAVWCLGDIVGYGPAPNECIARIRGLNPLVITGNHDQEVVGNIPLPLFHEGARKVLEWTLKVIKPENLKWLGQFEPLKVLPDFNVTLVHASLQDPLWEYIESPEIAIDNLALLETSFCFYGHTHRPLAICYRAAVRKLNVDFLPERQPYLLQPKLLLNPGSVGQPRDGDPRAAFAIYDTDEQILTSYRYDYDIGATQRAMQKAGLPPRMIDRLAKGA